MVEVRPLAGQIDDLIEEIRANAERGGRTLVAALTKRACEDLSQYLADIGIRAEWLHSDIDAIGRVDILGRLRRGDFDALIGVNLLREGLDLPEVTRVAILDADKEGFLRSETSLIQTAGRCARNVDGKVILYADIETPAIKAVLDVTREHRAKQEAYNAAHGIVPHTVRRAINEDLTAEDTPGGAAPPTPGQPRRGKGRHAPPKKPAPTSLVAESGLAKEDLLEALSRLEAEMRQAAEALEFERAALLRDELRALRKEVR